MIQVDKWNENETTLKSVDDKPASRGKTNGRQLGFLFCHVKLVCRRAY